MIQNVKEFSRLFYATTHMPLTARNTLGGCICSFPQFLEESPAIDPPLLDILRFSKNPDYTLMDSSSYFGYVKLLHEDSCLLVGPVFPDPVTDSTVRSFMREWAVSSRYQPEVSRFLADIPQVSFNQFLHTLAYLHLCLNSQELDIVRHFKLAQDQRLGKISRVHSDQLTQAKENKTFHNTYHFEQQLMHFVQKGDVAGLKNLLQSSHGLVRGTIAFSTLRQEKNIFITITSFATRSAITGGLDVEEAYHLSDVYILECEKSQSIKEISELSYMMLVDFTQRVSKNKIPKGMSPEVFDCIQFISHHTNEPIKASDVADYAKRSRSYILKKFKEELGFDISNFIMRCKLEEAKILLQFSDKSISEISNYLCFSSQGYFQNVFKKKYGLTPLQYRKQADNQTPNDSASPK